MGLADSNPDKRPSDVVDLDLLYPLAWGIEACSHCGRDTTTTNAWGYPWCAECWEREREEMQS